MQPASPPSLLLDVSFLFNIVVFRVRVPPFRVESDRTVDARTYAHVRYVARLTTFLIVRSAVLISVHLRARARVVIVEYTKSLGYPFDDIPR